MGPGQGKNTPLDALGHSVLSHQPLMLQSPHRKDSQSICKSTST